MEVDWSGTAMRLSCEATGEVATAHLFVACLPYSQCSYVEATLDMRQNTWLTCHVHAWEFFGGVAVRTVCDNLKVASSSTRATARSCSTRRTRRSDATT